MGGCQLQVAPVCLCGRQVLSPTSRSSLFPVDKGVWFVVRFYELKRDLVAGGSPAGFRQQEWISLTVFNGSAGYSLPGSQEELSTLKLPMPSENESFICVEHLNNKLSCNKTVNKCEVGRQHNWLYSLARWRFSVISFRMAVILSARSNYRKK